MAGILGFIKLVLIFITVPLFLIGVGGYVLVRLKLRPGEKETEQTYYEYEERHQAFRRYELWSRFTLTLIVLSMLLAFLVITL